MELFSCQQSGAAISRIDISGNSVLHGTGLGLRVEPCVNAHLTISSNRFHNIENSALLIRNAKHPQLAHLPTEVLIYKNDIKLNTGPQFIVSIGLNEDAISQRLVFNQQNELRMNNVINPFPLLKARSTPYAVLIVSSSNVLIQHNCFGNPKADYEIGTELMEHAKRIDARKNNWGDAHPHNFMHRIFDQFNRYSLALIDVNPFSAVCNHRMPAITYLQQYYRPFRQTVSPYVIGGAIYENSDLHAGTYTVIEDLHVTAGAKLTLASGTRLEFMNGVGMLVQGELIRSDYLSPLIPVTFTSSPFHLPKLEDIRLVDELGNEDVLAGRLEVKLEDGLWGTVCNRSWTANLAQLACNQLGLTMDPQYFENWRIFPSAGELHIRMDNIRCEEREYDLTRCRHDGTFHNADSPLSCRPTEVVGIRCVEPHWAGVRYSLLASPPAVTGQVTMHNWIIEKAGLFDFRNSIFSPALQVDWNYHVFNGLTIRDNFYNGMDIIYNDLTKKPAIRRSSFIRNRRNGLVIRSNGITIENVVIESNMNAGIHYNSRVDASLQRDIASWLDGREQPELDANNIRAIPPLSGTVRKPIDQMSSSYGFSATASQRNFHGMRSSNSLDELPFFINGAMTTDQYAGQEDVIEVYESQLNHRMFLVAKPTKNCPIVENRCVYEFTLRAVGHQFGLDSKLAIQIVNRWHNESDEDFEFFDIAYSRRQASGVLPIQPSSSSWSVRRNTIEFPIISSSSAFRVRYTRSVGRPAIILLVLFLDAQEYLDRFVHVYESTIRRNQYAISAVHYNNLTFWDDGAVLARQADEKIWFQKVNFTQNANAVIWIHSPQHNVLPGTPFAKISWIIDNCSLSDNFGPIVDTHRDLYSSANVFAWNFWSNTFANNSNAGINVQLADTYDLLAHKEHQFLMTENRFESNINFSISLHGYYAFVNISSNNFTDNFAPNLFGLMQLSGMEKHLIMERNRFFNNWGTWMARIETLSQTLRGVKIPAFVQYNYFQFNHFIARLEDYVDMWPRSYALGVFGVQKVDVHFNRFRNVLMDFELVAGCNPKLPGVESMNVTYNWWGVANEAEVSQRIFDLDDWNIYTVANYSPYYTTEELFINFWWNPNKGQLSYANYTEPSVLDLKGRMFESKTLALEAERWYPFPYYYRPFRPYRITKDLTIMPGATLTIERNVEVHVWPNVRILVLGNLIADGTLWQPIRFRPINVTEYAQQQGRAGTRYRRAAVLKKLLNKKTFHREHSNNLDARFIRFIYKRNKRRTLKDDMHENVDVFRQFPEMRRENSELQRFSVCLTENGTISGRSGFLSYYNQTTGEIIPSCDRFFTMRNAQVVCRELGFESQNAYHWLTPRWDYNPQVQILKTYVEPRQCRGKETRLDKCELRLSGTTTDWQCVDSKHFNYIHCGRERAISSDYYGHWGGITFASATLEYAELTPEQKKDISILRHVEIIGGGISHADAIKSASLQAIGRSPVLENINVTNSAMHAVQIVAPTDNVILNQINVSDIIGQGINIVSANLHSQANSNTAVPQGALNLPYMLPGLLDICASGKTIKLKSRILVYYKYDSVAVDCVKIFSLSNENRQSSAGKTTTQKTLGFRFLQVNFYEGVVGVGRADALSIYADASFEPTQLLRRFDALSAFRPNHGPPTVILPHRQRNPMPTMSEGARQEQYTSTMGVHLRATAADGHYGFLAEIFVLPSTPVPKYVDEITVRNSRIIKNDRGAISYRNVGEIGPNVIIEQCSIRENGYFLFGNVSSSAQAIELYLHNTILFLFRANAVHQNQGGMLVLARSSSSVAQLNGVVKNSAFIGNSNSTTLAFIGNNYQKVTLVNNVLAQNTALHFDTILVDDVSTNLTRNLFVSNIGLHIIDTHSHHFAAMNHPSNPASGASSIFGPAFSGDMNGAWSLRDFFENDNSASSSTHVFNNNFFDNNLALGHDYQYAEAFGYLPVDDDGEHGRYDEFKQRPRRQIRENQWKRRSRRQVLSQSGVSFDWWTHVGSDTSRYRSTILVGASPQQKFVGNIFNDPRNAYELTTSIQTDYDTNAVDARENYWGYPSTAGVAAGKIRDKSDYPLLARVDYLPVLESNTSLIEGDCPAGWFQVGKEEFKSCFLFVAASMTYTDAVTTCEQIGAFMPILRKDDARQREIATRVDAFSQQFIVDVERYNTFAMSYDVPIWMSSVALPSHQCGWMSSRTTSIGEQNCNNLLPFVCEKGTKPYQEPIMWRQDIVLFAVAFSLLCVALLLLLLLALCKSQRRKENFAKRKVFVRDSLRRKSLTLEKLQTITANTFGNSNHNKSALNGGGTVQLNHFQPLPTSNVKQQSKFTEHNGDIIDSTVSETTYESCSYMVNDNSISTSTMSSDYDMTNKEFEKQNSNIDSSFLNHGKNNTFGVSMDPDPQRSRIFCGHSDAAAVISKNNNNNYSFCCSSSSAGGADSIACTDSLTDNSLVSDNTTYCSCFDTSRSSSTITTTTVVANDELPPKSFENFASNEDSLTTITDNLHYSPTTTIAFGPNHQSRFHSKTNKTDSFRRQFYSPINVKKREKKQNMETTRSIASLSTLRASSRPDFTNRSNINKISASSSNPNIYDNPLIHIFNDNETTTATTAGISTGKTIPRPSTSSHNNVRQTKKTKRSPLVPNFCSHETEALKWKMNKKQEAIKNSNSSNCAVKTCSKANKSSTNLKDELIYANLYGNDRFSEILGAKANTKRRKKLQQQTAEENELVTPLETCM